MDIFNNEVMGNLPDPILLSEDQQKIVDSLSYSGIVFRAPISLTEEEKRYVEARPNRVLARNNYKQLVCNERFLWRVKTSSKGEHISLPKYERTITGECPSYCPIHKDLVQEPMRPKRTNLARRIYKRIIKWFGGKND